MLEFVTFLFERASDDAIELKESFFRQPITHFHVTFLFKNIKSIFSSFF